MAWYAWILIGIIIGFVGAYYMFRPSFGDKHEYDIEKLANKNKKNKNSTLDNDINASMQMSEKSNKQRRRKKRRSILTKENKK